MKVGDEVIHVPQSDPTSVEDFQAAQRASIERTMSLGRWPANLIHDGSEEVLHIFPNAPGQIAPSIEDGAEQGNRVYGKMKRGGPHHTPRKEMDNNAARFFYCTKASRSDRGEDNNHPTVKPTDLMRYLCRLVTRPSGTILDPFMGSGSTGKAAALEGFNFIGIENNDEAFGIASHRVWHQYNTVDGDGDSDSNHR